MWIRSSSISGSPDREGNAFPTSRQSVRPGATAGRPDLLEPSSWGVICRCVVPTIHAARGGFFVPDARSSTRSGEASACYLPVKISPIGSTATQTGPVKTLGSPLLIMGGVRAEF
jgi:hypothetical protein